MRREIYTGGLMERELFDQVQEAADRQKPEKPKEYLPFAEALELVKKLQPFKDPSDPKPRFANDLHARLAEILDLTDYRQLKFFTAVGSVLDKFHGIDAFFELERQRKIFRATLDVTIRPQKTLDSGRADVVFYIPQEGLDPKSNRQDYLLKIDEVARAVAENLKMKFKQEGL